MDHATTIEEMRRRRRALPGTVAFVPTLGCLHEGHLTLMREGLRRCDHLVVSVFVNPTQFGADEDLDEYPRDIAQDAEKCRGLGCDILFTPSEDQIYADDDCTRVIVDELDQSLCGPGRPGHFEGVTTVVAKLLHIVSPDIAVFGQKDYQQLAIVRRMVRDLHFDVEIADVPIVRERDGLAMSSRNRYLSDEQRRQATSLSQGLVAAHRAFHRDRDQPCRQLVEAARKPIAARPDTRIDYVECVHPHTLAPLDPDHPAPEAGAVVAVAVHLGSARLIDNLRLDQPLPQGPLHHIP